MYYVLYTYIFYIYLACTCNQNGTHVCDTATGECHCNARYNGTLCDECAEGFANFPYCTGIFSYKKDISINNFMNYSLFTC